MKKVKKYHSLSGLTLQVGSLYPEDGNIVTSLEDNDMVNLRVTTNDVYLLPYQPGDYLSYEDGSGRILKQIHEPQLV